MKRLVLRVMLGLAGWALAVDASHANAPPPVVRLGFQGHYRLGHWTPITVTIPGAEDAQHVMAAVPDDEGELARFVWPADRLRAERWQGTVRCGHPVTRLQVGVDSKPLSNAQMEPPPQAVMNSQQLAVVLGELDLTSSIRLQQRRASETLVACNLTDVRDLPHEWFAWEGVDLLVIPTGQLTQIDALQPTQWEAIVTWVRLGGRVIISMGVNAESLLGDESPFATFAPGKLAQVIRQRETGGLENYASLSRRARGKRISLADEEGRFVGIPTLAFESVDGVVKSSDGRGTSRVDWVIQRSYGLGIVTFISTDLDVGPLASWEGRSRLITKLLDETLPGAQDDASERDSQAVSHFGFNDISGQLRSALEQFPGVRLIPFGLIGAIAAGFTILIGPLDFLVFGRDPARTHWTWVSLAVAVLGTTLGILWLADTWKGSAFRCNQVNLIDIDIATGSVRGTTWADAYVPEASEIEATLQPADSLGSLTTEDRLVAWHGLAGSGFGGMSSGANVGRSLPPYHIVWSADASGSKRPVHKTQITDLLIPQWSSRRLGGLWHAKAEMTVPSPLRVTPRTELLEGQLTNPLAVTLKSAYLCFDRWRYDLGDLQPGETFAFDQSVIPFDLQSKLTNRQIMDAKQIASPWDDENLDVARIMEMIMFHDAAGGRSYTSLLHRQSAKLDLSAQLKLRRAVLVGRVPDLELGVQLSNASDAVFEPQAWNFVRVMLEVVASNAPTRDLANKTDRN